jgi:glycosyltransferase involved in cell wall biosynthesis
MEQNGQSMYPRVSVIIPTRNEALNIGHVLATLPPDVFEVLIVDGDSDDGTVDVARALRPDVRVIRQRGKGKGDALATGLAECSGDVVVTLDADGSADGAEIPRFVDALVAGADYAKGSRFIPGGGSSDLTRLRALGNRLLCALVNAFYGTRYSDLCYGYNAAWTSELRRLDLDCPGFEIETVMNIRSAKLKLRIAEVPSFEAPRLHGESNLHTFRDGWRVLCAIARERRGPARAPLAELAELAPSALGVSAAASVAAVQPVDMPGGIES